MYSASGIDQHDGRMPCWRSDVLAAEARKAESVSEVADGYPDPVPNRETGVQPLNVGDERVRIATNTLPRQVVETVKGGCPAHETQRGMCKNRGALNDDRSNMRVS